MLMAVGLLIGTNVWANLPAKVALASEAKTDMPQVEKQQKAEPQPFVMATAQQSSMRKAPKRAALSTEAITDDQVTLEVNGVQVGTTYSIVDAFKYVNANCSADDSAAITLQKNIDLAMDDYGDKNDHYYGVTVEHDRKVLLDLNGYNFKSNIQTGTANGNNDGKWSALIFNKGTLYVSDNTFNSESIYNALPDDAGFDNMFEQNTLALCDESADTRGVPSYGNAIILNYGKVTIIHCKMLMTSYGRASYCVDMQNTSYPVNLWIEGGYLFSKYCSAVRQYLTSADNSHVSDFTMDRGVMVGMGACIWTQFGSKGQPVSYTNFSGGKCLAAWGRTGHETDDFYGYYSYTDGASLENVKVNFSGTEFNTECYFGAGARAAQKSDSINIYGGKFAGEMTFAASNEVVNIYDGEFDNTVMANYSYGTQLNIFGGTFKGKVSVEYPAYYNSDYQWNIHCNDINIHNGEFYGLVLVYYTEGTMNIYGGHFVNCVALEYAYRSKLNIYGGTFDSSVENYLGDYAYNNGVDNNKITITDGLFGYNIKATPYGQTTDVSKTIDIVGGYYQYDCKFDYNGSVYYWQKHWCEEYNPYDINWISYIRPGYAKEEQYDEEADEYTPYVTKDDVDYYFRVGQEVKTPATIDDEGKIVVPDGDGGTREPEPTDNIELNTEEIDRDTIYLDNLNVNGLTFRGKDTIDVIAKPGSIVVVGSSGIKATDTTTVYMTVEGGGSMKVGVEAIQKVDTVIVKSDVNGNGTLLISPNAQLTEAEKFATVKLYVDGARKVDDTYYIWQHVAVPTDGTGTFTVENDRKATDPSFRTHVQWWNDALASENKWQKIGNWSDMNHPWRGYILTTNSTTPGVTYSFTGNIIGNSDGQLHFDSKGYNFFGNSYTAPINVQTMLNGISNGEDIEMTVWVYSAAKLRYLESNNLMRLLGMAEFDQISSMQGFWLRNMTDSYGQNSSVNYTNAVWNNPGAMSNPKVKAPARKAVAADMNLNVASIIVSDFDQSDRVILVEGEEYSDEFDNGSDASKMMTEGALNLYAATSAGDLACVATDNMEGTLLAFQAGEQDAYSITFANVVGEDYVLYDMMTGTSIAMKENNTYTFTAEPKSVNSARFLVCSARKTPTALDNCETTSQVSGVYTVMGQYVGDSSDFANLPNGIYIINGIKVVK